MIQPGQTAGVRVYVATAAVDGRKSFDTLAEVVRTALGHDPLSGDHGEQHRTDGAAGGTKLKMIVSDIIAIFRWTERMIYQCHG